MFGQAYKVATEYTRIPKYDSMNFRRYASAAINSNVVIASYIAMVFTFWENYIVTRLDNGKMSVFL